MNRTLSYQITAEDNNKTVATLDATDVILEAGVSDQMLREYIAKSMTEAKENSNSVDNNYRDLALFSGHLTYRGHHFGIFN